MKRILILILAFISISIRGQENLVNTSVNFSEYIIDTITHSQVSIEFLNVTNEPLLMWFEKENIINLSSEEKYRKYFKNQKGDFNLTHLIYEININDISDILFLTFYKIVEPAKSFEIVILDSNENCSKDEIVKWIEEHFVTVQHNESKGMLPIGDLEKLNYKSGLISIDAEKIIKSENENDSFGQDTILYRGFINGNLLYETIELYADNTFKWTSEYDLSWDEYGLYKIEGANVKLDYYLSFQRPSTMSLLDTIKHINSPMKIENLKFEKDRLFRLNESGRKIHRIKDKSIGTCWSRILGHKYELIEY